MIRKNQPHRKEARRAAAAERREAFAKLTTQEQARRRGYIIVGRIRQRVPRDATDSQIAVWVKELLGVQV